jgi:hypothetical protein
MGFFDPFNLKLASRFEDVQIFGAQGFAHGVSTMEMSPKAGGKRSLARQIHQLLPQMNDASWRYAGDLQATTRHPPERALFFR